VDRASNRAFYTPINANEMSLTRIGAVIKNPFTGKAITAKAPVDTGNILTAVPRRAADELQLPVIGRRRIATVKGTTELDECIGIVEMTPSPPLGRRGFTLGVLVVTSSLGVTKNPSRAIYKPIPRSGGNPP